MTPGESTPTGARCDLCKQALEPEVTFCPECGFPVQDKFEAGTASGRAYESVMLCHRGHWYNACLGASCPLCYRRYLRPLFSPYAEYITPEQRG
jgi:hypothetical protein